MITGFQFDGESCGHAVRPSKLREVSLAIDTNGIFLTTNLLTFLINSPISRREYKYKHVLLSGLEGHVCGLIESFSGTIYACWSSCCLPFSHWSMVGRISFFPTSSRFNTLPLGKSIYIYIHTHTQNTMFMN